MTRNGRTPRIPAAPLLFCALLLAAAAARGDTRADLAQQFNTAVAHWDIGAASKAFEALRHRGVDKTWLTNAEALYTYLGGDYAGALKIVSGAHSSPFAHELYDRLTKLEPFFSKAIEFRSGNFIVRVPPGADRVLLDYSLPVLEAALKVDGEDLGVKLDSPVILEFYPSQESLYLASTLPLADIHRTGAVAICKFNRLILTTPRIYLQGYAWADTISHELTHYLIVKKTGHAVPIWLHEGIAKWQETRWRKLYRDRGLDPTSASLLNRAVETDTLVPFSRMHPSLAKLDSQEEAALAYAECVTFVEHFIRQTRGPRALARLLDEIAAGKSVEKAFEAVSGLPFDTLKARWLADLKAHPPKGFPGLIFQPRKLARGKDTGRREDELDPKVIDEARRFARLGDLLMQSSRFDGAITEYEKAEKHASGLVPQISIRLARAMIDRTRYEDATRVLDKLIHYYPDYVTAHKLNGIALMRLGNLAAAARELQYAICINPFDPEVHVQLSEVYERLNYAGHATREKKIAEQLID